MLATPKKNAIPGPPNVLSDAVFLGGEKIPTDFEFLCASFGSKNLGSENFGETAKWRNVPKMERLQTSPKVISGLANNGQRHVGCGAD